MDRATSNLTRFFRNSSQLKALEYIVLPDLLAHLRHAGEQNLRVWSAGCSTGEEAYTLSLLFRELLPASLAFTITATDRSPSALAGARRGIYPKASVQSVPPRFLERYFTRVGDRYRVVEAVRGPVRFRLEAIEDATEQEEYDIVFCRNVLTYLTEGERPAFAWRLWRAMRVYSYLFLGGSESLLGVESQLEYLSNEWCSLYRKR